MTLSAGARLGPYEVVSPLGAGGMGEVYRAKDTRLDREVALKVLPEHLSGSEELRSRFEREAKAISSLQHPHICTLYDVGREGETDFLVMELLEGESLADRLEKGPLPIDQVLKLGIQIADALEKAHGSGIVHRDLKPGNVFVTERGVKLLDFGLAKLHAMGPGSASRTQLGALPTEQLSAPLTSAGMILGTFQYMSPEQLEGKESDARSDLFALGCVLYEMATGKKAFSGSSQASLIGSIMHSSPAPVSSQAPLSPPALDRVIATCLEKDPKNRWHTAHDVRLQLAWIAEGGSQVGLPAPVVAHRKNRERLAWGLAAALAVAVAALAVGYVARAPKPERVARFEVRTPASLLVVGEPKISPDGGQIAFVGVDDQGEGRIWVRSLDALEARPLAGTEGVTSRMRPFWSPDSRFVAFIVDGKLKRVALDGGPAQKICDTPTGADGTWSEKGLILFDGQTNDPIRSCDAAGGVVRTHVAGPEGEAKLQVGWPQFLPGGEKFLYVTFGGKPEENGIRIADADGSDSKLIVDGLSRVEYAEPGYLVFVRETTLVAQRFDPEKGVLSGEPIPLVDGIGVDAQGQAEFSVSRAGVLVYRAGAASSSEFVWLDRKGNRVDAPLAEGELQSFDLSRDGRWLAYQQGGGSDADIWVRDLKRGVSSRFTFEKGGEFGPLFARDGARVIFSRLAEGGTATLVSRALDRTGTDQPIYAPNDPSERFAAGALSPDGRWLYIQRRTGSTAWNLQRLVLGSPAAEPELLVGGELAQVHPQLSPDGRWLAFTSFEAEPPEVYVVGVAGASGRWQVSTRGGFEPAWGPQGDELFYLSMDNRMMRVAVTTGTTFDAGVPEPLFPIALAPLQIRNRYRVAADGERFLVVAPAGQGAAAPMTVVLGWDAALHR
jgi:Tol biopolymer transport system component